MDGYVVLPKDLGADLRMSECFVLAQVFFAGISIKKMGACSGFLEQYINVCLVLAQDPWVDPNISGSLVFVRILGSSGPN